jgi:hypothetical protein
MAATTTLLGLVTPTQGTLTGTWGDTVNYGISDYVDIAVAGTLTLTNDGAVTLANTTGSSAGSNITSSLTGAGTVTAQFAIVKVTGTLTVAKVVTGPSYSKTYTVVNAATGGIVTFKASGQTGVSVAVGETAFVYFNGTDYVKIVGTATAGAAGGSNTQVQFNSSGILSGSSSLTWDGTTLSSTQVNITGQGTLRLQDTTGGEYVALRAPATLAGNYTLTFPADDGTSGQALITDGSGVLSWSTAASGDVYGPGSSTDNAVARFDSTTGKLIQNSVGILSDAGVLTGLTGLTSSGSITFSGLTSGRITYAGTGGLLTDSANLTFTSGVLTVSNTGGRSVSATGTSALFASNGTAHSLIIGDNNYAYFQLYTAASPTYLAFQYNASEKMRLDSDGNLGLGTTPSSWFPSGKFLQFPYGAVGSTSNGYMDITNNAYEYASNAYRYNITAGATRYEQQFGLHAWFTAPSGTAGSVATFTQAMTLDAAGTLFVNSTARPSGIGGGDNGKLWVKQTTTGNYGISSIASATDSFISIANTGTVGLIGTSYGSTGSYLPLAFYTSDVERARITASGDFGIGTASPSVKLEVAGSVRFARSGVATQYISFFQDSSNNRIVAEGTSKVLEIRNNNITSGGISFDNIVPSSYLFYQGGVEFVRISSTGLVGIGTSSPTQKLTVAGAINLPTDATNPNSGVSLWSQAGVGATLSGLNVVFNTGANAAQTERMRIDTSGNVGIGTSSPASTLHVANTYTNTSDATIVASAVIPGINLRTPSTGRFSIFTSYSSSNSTSFVVGTGTSNPSTEAIAIDHATGNTKFISAISVGFATPTSSGAGITFPATQSASSDANTLDDYEEGTWTPAYAPTAGAFTTATYSPQYGFYQKIGNTVNLQMYIYLTGFSIDTISKP